MELPTLDSYKVVRTLGQGGFSKVKLVRDQFGVPFAAKILKNLDSDMQARLQDSILNEVENLKQLNHPNILRLVEVKKNGVYTKRNNSQRVVSYLLLEVCPNGSLFDYVFKNGFMDEGTARFYFKQLVSSVEACHSAGICHRDIKPENVLFDADLNIKLSDFGFSIATEGRRGTGYLGSEVGTQGYMAPEILLHEKYKGESVDIFSLGVVLFIMRAYNPPFLRASLADPYYALLLNKEANYWEFCSRKKPQGHFSDDFKSLIRGMLAFEPEDRFSMRDIKRSAWYNGPATAPVVSASRSLDETLTSSRVESTNIPEATRARFSGRLYRGSQTIRSCSILNEEYRIKNITREEIGVIRYGYIFTSLEVNSILECIVNVLESANATFNQFTEDLFLKVSADNLEMKINFFKFEDMILVDFKKVSGNEYELVGLFQEINLAIRVTEEEVNKGESSEFLRS